LCHSQHQRQARGTHTVAPGLFCTHALAGVRIPDVHDIYNGHTHDIRTHLVSCVRAYCSTSRTFTRLWRGNERRHALPSSTFPTSVRHLNTRTRLDMRCNPCRYTSVQDSSTTTRTLPARFGKQPCNPADTLRCKIHCQCSLPDKRSVPARAAVVLGAPDESSSLQLCLRGELSRRREADCCGTLPLPQQCTASRWVPSLGCPASARARCESHTSQHTSGARFAAPAFVPASTCCCYAFPLCST
jgi:hypothetical protein